MGKVPKRSPLLSLYIFLYNVVLFVIHLVIFIKLVNSQLTGNFVYAEHFLLFCIGTAAQLLDVVHGILGITSTGVVAGIIQVLGRLSMLYIVEGNPTIHNQISTPILLFAWVLIELFRYPYYAFRAWNIEVYILAWLRYSAWIPLYPLGLVMEWISQVSSLKYYYESEKYALRIPNTDLRLNFAFVLGMLAFVAMPFLSRKLLGHMSKQRRNKLSPAKRD
ncbi:tyrosine phosphatase-like protein, PTPLA [Ancylostoma caninum]|uniref:Very-long-chain (3R)-3-hydroxyacyl-CoA dehydratase n=1 Tax=Ancylostoma caninum TaxID=29170 RepID=A0A368FF19_ANCCA|nr:tyrosine phosphatase-like protein, PTPLA [Ancylostoma caninum]